MEPQLASPGNGGVIETVDESEGRVRALFETAIGNSAVRSAMRVMALTGITGSVLAAVGPLATESQAADTSLHDQTQALMAGPHQPAKEHHKSSTVSHTGNAAPVCTDIVPYPGGYYFGEACSNDRLVELGKSKSGKFDYGMLIIKGAYTVYKCGYVEAGFVPIERGPHKSAGYCRRIARSILNPHFALKDLSCDPGDCSGGKPTPVSPKCEPDVKMYDNFTTTTRSPFNVYPNGKSGFVGFEGEQPDRISYRATIAQSSQVGPAAIAWGPNVQEWGLTEQECIPLPVLINSHATNSSPPIKLG